MAIRHSETFGSMLSETSSEESTPESHLGLLGRDSFRSITSERDRDEAEEDNELGSPTWGAVSTPTRMSAKFDALAAKLDLQSSVPPSSTDVRSRSTSRERPGLSLGSLDDLTGPPARNQGVNNSTGSRNSHSSFGGCRPRFRGGGHGRSTSRDHSSRENSSSSHSASHSANHSASTTPTSGTKSLSFASAGRKGGNSTHSAGSSPTRKGEAGRGVNSPTALLGAKVFRSVLPTCRASDARRHKKASKWDNVDDSMLDHSDSDDGDSLLDSYASRPARGSRKGASGGGFSLGAIRGLGSGSPSPAGGRKLSQIRRIVSEQVDGDQVSQLRASAAGERRRTMNAALRRRPSHLGSLNLGTLTMSKPKYDSAHMWHLHNEGRAGPQNMSCAEVSGFFFIDFDRTLAKRHTFKESVKLGIKGLQLLPTETIIDWFGGEERLGMCKAYLNALANMNVATVVITHGAPPLVYQMMRMAGFFPSAQAGDGHDVATDDSDEPSAAAPTPRASGARGGYTAAASRIVRKTSRGGEGKVGRRTSPLKLNLSAAISGGTLAPIEDEPLSARSVDCTTSQTNSSNNNRSDSGSRGSSSKKPKPKNIPNTGTTGFGGQPVDVLQQNEYGIVAIYGQSTDSAEKFLKSQCINDVVLKLSGKHADELGCIVFADDDRKNIMGVKRVCNFSTQQLLKINPNTAMTEADFQAVVKAFNDLA